MTRARPLQPVHRRTEALLTGAVALVIALLLFRHVLADPAGRKIAGNTHDVDLYTWWLQHTASSLFHGRELFVTHALNAPGGVNAMWNTAVILPGALMAPVTLLAGPLASYNVLVVVALTATGATAHLLLRRFVARPAAARAGALLWTFCPAILGSEFGHLALVLTALVPLMLICVDELVRGTRDPVKVGAALGVLAAAQVLTGEEVLFLTALLAIVSVLIAALLAPRRALSLLPRLLVAGVAAAVVFLVLAGYPLYIQFLGPLHQHGSPFLTSYFVSDLRGFITPSRQFLASTTAQSAFAASYGGGVTEYLAYVGAPLLVVTVGVALGVRRVRVVTVGAVAALVLAVGSLGSALLVDGSHPGIDLPWHLLDGLPVVENALPDRFTLVVDLCLAALVAIGLDRIVLPGGIGTRVAGTLAGAVVVFSLLPHVYDAEPTDPVPAFFTDGAPAIAHSATALVLPYPTPQTSVAMRWQSAAHDRFAMPGGYFIGPASDGHAFISGQGPLATARLFDAVATTGQLPTLTAGVRADFAADVATWQARTIVVGPTTYAQQLAATVTALTGASPTADRGVLVWQLRG